LAGVKAETTEGPAHSAGPSIVPRVVPLVTLVAVTVAVAATTLRSSYPPLYAFAEDVGYATAALVVPPVYLAGLLAPVVRAVAGPRGLIGVGVGGLLLCRLVTQVITPDVWLAFAGTALTMIALAGLFEAARGMSGGGFAVAALGGLALDTAVRVASGTLDTVWGQGPGPWLTCLAFVAAGVAALVTQLRATPVPPPGVAWRDALGALAWGPFLVIQILTLSSPAFVASAAGVSAAVAGAAVLGAQALAIVLLTSGVAARAVPGGVCVLGGTVLGIAMGAVTGPYALGGPAVVLGAVVVGQVLAGWLVAVACRAALGHLRSGRGSAVRIDIAAAAGGFVVIAVLMPYQLHYEAPLPFPSAALPGAAGLLLGLAAASAAARSGPPPRWSPRRVLVVAAASVFLLVAPLIVALTGPGPARGVRVPGSVRVVSYNIHEAVDGAGRLNPEAVATVIEGQRADVVLLQEVGRGWPISATTDLCQWFARRLGMRLVWGPAADGQFGNAVLTRLPVRASGTGRLPQGDGPMVRGYVWARVEVGGGRTLDAWSTHLQHRSDQTSTRLAQIETLLRAWSGAPNTVIGGDMNAGPGSREMGRFFDETGLRSAQDDTGHGSLATRPPAQRIDWILGTSDLGFSDFVIPRVGASDHLPLAVTVRPTGR
jgi:endonuclease/exonuclease/phosphatase family metal-dependent hydrolase